MDNGFVNDHKPTVLKSFVLPFLVTGATKMIVLRITLLSLAMIFSKLAKKGNIACT